MLLAAVAYLLWPGELIYPTDEGRLRSWVMLQEEANATLEARIEQLRVTLGENACYPAVGNGDGVVLPDVSGERPADSGTVTLPLIDRLDRATVLVFWQTEDEVGHGSGFLITPALIVTNRHVVDAPPQAEIFVSGSAVGGVIRAEVIARSTDDVFGKPDFAILRVPESAAAGILPTTHDVERLQSMVAAGYPDLVMKSDGDFQRLFEGDASAMPVPAMSFVALSRPCRTAPGKIPIILHSATVTGGNSGGPLTDECGRLVGVNTFIEVDEHGGAQMNYALGTDALLAFLDQHGLQRPPVDDAVCDPSTGGGSR